MIAKADATQLPETIRETIVLERYGLVMKLDTLSVPTSILTSPGTGDRRPHLRVYHDGKLVLDRTPRLRKTPHRSPAFSIWIERPGHAWISVDEDASGRYPVSVDPRVTASDDIHDDFPSGGPRDTTAFGSGAIHVVTVACAPVIATYQFREPPRADKNHASTLVIERDGTVRYRGPISRGDDNMTPYSFGCLDDGGERSFVVGGGDYIASATSIWSYRHGDDAYRETFEAWGVGNQRIGSDPETGDLLADVGDRRVKHHYLPRGFNGPLRVLRYFHGRFHDVTTHYPSQIKHDAADIRDRIMYVHDHRAPDVMDDACRSYLADEMNLGETVAGLRFLRAYCPDDDHDGFRKMLADLRRLGYP